MMNLVSDLRLIQRVTLSYSAIINGHDGRRFCGSETLALTSASSGSTVNDVSTPIRGNVAVEISRRSSCSASANISIEAYGSSSNGNGGRPHSSKRFRQRWSLKIMEKAAI